MLPLNTYLELRRSRWLEKISNMDGDRIPSKLIGSWLPYARRNSSVGRPKKYQTCVRTYVKITGI